MTLLFRWLDAHPALYWGLAGAALALLAGWFVAAAKSGEQRPRAWGGIDLAAVVLMVALLIAGRWPALLEMQAPGRQEAELLAGALALAADPLPFRAIDLGSEGPLAAAVLLPAHALGLPQDYFNARLMALLLDGGTLILAYLLLRRSLEPVKSLLGLLPFLLLVAGTHLPPIHEYSSWHLQGFLLMLLAGQFQWWEAWGKQDWRGHLTWIAAGLFLGLLPWTNRYGAISAAAIWSLAFTRMPAMGANPAGRRRALLYAGALGVYVTVAVACFWRGMGQGAIFWHSYVLGEAWFRPGGEPGLSWIFRLLFLLLPGMVFLTAENWRRPQPRVLASGLIIFSVAALVGQVAAGQPTMFGRFAESWRRPYSDLGVQLRAQRQPGQRLLVWGVRPELYVETGLPPAISIPAITDRGTASAARRAAFEARVVDGLNRTKPSYLVNARPSEWSRDQTAFPQATNYLSYAYRLVSDDETARLYGRTDLPVRIVRGGHTHRFLVRDDIRIIEATGSISELGEGRWFAHAPSEFVHSVPPGARILRGVCGFLPNAYENPHASTDGARFLIEAISPKGSTEVLFDRALNPRENPSDREPVKFRVDLPVAGAGELRFTIQPGKDTGFDWTYWGGLELEFAAGR